MNMIILMMMMMIIIINTSIVVTVIVVRIIVITCQSAQPQVRDQNTKTNADISISKTEARKP